MGRRRLEIRDWLFGSEPRRRLLETILAGEVGEDWRKVDLARAVGLFEKGSVETYVEALVELELLSEHDGRYWLNRESPLVEPLEALLSALGELVETPQVEP